MFPECVVLHKNRGQAAAAAAMQGKIRQFIKAHTVCKNVQAVVWLRITQGETRQTSKNTHTLKKRKESDVG